MMQSEYRPRIPMMLTCLKYSLAFLISLYVSLGSVAAIVQQDNSVLSSPENLLPSSRVADLSAQSLLDSANYYTQRNPNLSRVYSQALLEHPFLKENPSFRIKCLLDIGSNINKQGDIKSALEYLQEGFDLGKSMGDERLIMQAHNKLGIYYNDRGDNVLSSDHHLKSLQFANEIKDTFGMLKGHVNLTSIFIDLNRPEKSIEYGINGLSLSRAFRNIRVEGFLLNNIAIAHITQDEPEKAKEYLLRALEISEKRNEPERIARNHSNLCNAYRLLGNMKQAAFHCQQASNIVDDLENPRSIMLHAIIYGKYYLDTGQLNYAITQAEKAKSIGESHLLNLHLGESYDLLHEIYKKQGKYRESLNAYETFWEIKHGSLNTSNNIQIAAIEESYQELLINKERIQKESEIELLKNESTLSSLQRNYALGAALLMGALGFFAYSRYSLKTKTNKILLNKNEEIKSQSKLLQNTLDEKEVLLKEIHHRVKNNLQIVSSLLNIQSKKSKSKEVLDFVSDGKNRIEAMSLIHQNLYQSSNISTIGMQDYLSQLLDNLSKSYNTNQKKISHIVKAPGIQLDIDTAIPIGLIVNELVSNAYKHAFTNLTSGHIIIRMDSLTGGHYQLIVLDDGVGVGSNIQERKSKSIGISLVKTLGVKQLKGEFDMVNSNGTKATLLFKHES